MFMLRVKRTKRVYIIYMDAEKGAPNVFSRQNRNGVGGMRVVSRLQSGGRRHILSTSGSFCREFVKETRGWECAETMIVYR